MKIVYCGTFLGQGLRQAGHEVVEIRLRSDRSLNDLVEAACPAPDIVLLELWGRTDLPLELHQCRHRLAAYGIDAPINEFWLRPLMRVVDHVFVDQLSSAEALRRHGINAAWLPLCVLEEDFLPPQEKVHFLTFVGRTTRHRTKRKNLLQFLKERYPVTIADQVSRQEMQRLFARSQVVLNENLFNGLTLRVFQALAAGAVLLTEEGGCGVAEHFRDGEHLICYRPDTILDILSDMRAHSEKYRAVGERGQEQCRKYHTSAARARTVLERLEKETARNPRLPSQARAVAEAEARYLHAMRYGGPIAEGLRVFAGHGALSGESARRAAHGLGSIAARRGDLEQARSALSLAVGLEGAEGFVAAGKLALVCLRQGQTAEAVRVLDAALARLPLENRNGPVTDAAVAEARPQTVFLFLAEVLLGLGRAFDLGFLKPGREQYPDYALEYAFLAWDAAHDPEALDLVIRCATACGAESESLDLLKSAIAEGAATERQTLYAAELARRLYDTETAKAIAGSLHRLLASRVAGRTRA